MRNLLAFAAVFCLPALACADGDEHMHDHQQMETEAASLGDAPIKITITPEARVSVTLAGELPPPVTCGTPTDLSVKILNRGFVTVRLEAQFVGEPPVSVTLDFHPEPLKGVPQELRKLRVTLTKPGLTDLTIAFKAHNEFPDLGGRDRVHFLMRCLEAA